MNAPRSKAAEFCHRWVVSFGMAFGRYVEKTYGGFINQNF